MGRPQQQQQQSAIAQLELYCQNHKMTKSSTVQHVKLVWLAIRLCQHAG